MKSKYRGMANPIDHFNIDMINGSNSELKHVDVVQKVYQLILAKVNWDMEGENWNMAQGLFGNVNLICISDY